MSLKNKSKNELIKEINELKKQLRSKKSISKLKNIDPTTFETIPFAYVLFDETKVYYVNNAAKKLLKLTKKHTDNLHKLSIYDFIKKEYHTKIKEGNKLVAQGKTLNGVTSECLDTKGNSIFIESLSKTVYYQGKKVFQGFFRDITEKKKAQNELIKSKENFENIVSKIDEVVFYFNKETNKVEYISDQLYNLIGIKAEEYIKNPKQAIKLAHPDDLKKINEVNQKINKLKTPQTLVYRVFHQKLKKYNWIEEKIFPQFNEKKQHIANLGISRNISLQKEIELELTQKENTLKNLFNNLPGMAYRCLNDKNWTMQFLSDGCFELTGHKPSNFINNNKISYADIIHSDDRLFVEEKVALALKKKTNFEIEYRIINKNNDLLWVWERGEGIYDNKGKLVYLEGFISNISERKKAETELNQKWLNYKNLIDKMPVGVFIHENGKIIFGNEEAIRIAGVKNNKELSEINLFNFLKPKDQEIAMQRMKTAMQGGEPPQITYPITNLKNEKFIVNLTTSPVIFNGKQALQIIFQDITKDRLLEQEKQRAQTAELYTKQLQEEILNRKQTEEELNKTKNYLQSIIDSSLDMITASDKNGKIIEFNKAALKAFGYKPNEIIGKSANIMFSEKTNQKEGILTLLTTGVFKGEVINKRKNGKEFISYLSASLLKNNKGEIIGTMGVSRDITEIKYYQEKTLEQATKLNAIIENSHHQIWSMNTNIELTSFNKNYEKFMEDIFGIKPKIGDSMIKEPFISTPEKNREVKEFFKQALNGQKVEFIYCVKNKKGETVWRETFLSPIYDKNNKLSEISGIANDITLRKQIEEEKNRQTALIKAIFESSSHLIYTVNKNYKITSFNKNYFQSIKENYGYETFIGKSLVEENTAKFPLKEHNNWIKLHQEALEGKTGFYKSKIKKSNGETLYFETFLDPVYLPEGGIEEVSYISFNVTDKFLSEEQLKASLKEKEILLKEVHHRVKNNLQVISSILNLQSTYVKDRNTLYILRECQNRIKSMAFIHEALYQNKQFAEISFDEYLIMLVKNLFQSFHVNHTNIKLKFDVEKVFLNIDTSIPCGLIVNELVSNAFKYAFPDNKQGFIFISLKKINDKVTLIIKDNGIGFSNEIDFRNTKSLGLQLVVTLVEQIGGEIKLDNNNGVKFEINFKQITDKNV